MPRASSSTVERSCMPGMRSNALASRAVTTKEYPTVAQTYANWMYNCFQLWLIQPPAAEVLTPSSAIRSLSANKPLNRSPTIPPIACSAARSKQAESESQHEKERLAMRSVAPRASSILSMNLTSPEMSTHAICGEVRKTYVLCCSWTLLQQ